MVQVDPIIPTLKAPGSERLKLQCDELLSTAAFKFNLRRYSPGIMFLDEPTTGLDSTNAAKVVDILSGLGKNGVTVLLSIHQPRPDIFRLLDRVLELSGSGSVVYSGPSAGRGSPKL